MSAAEYRAEAPFSLLDLVRAEVADDLRAFGHSLGARIVQRGINAADAEAVAADIALRFHHSTVRPFALACGRAVMALANGDVNGAVAILAEPCGISAEEWIAEARRERGL